MRFSVQYIDKVSPYKIINRENGIFALICQIRLCDRQKFYSWLRVGIIIVMLAAAGCNGLNSNTGPAVPSPNNSTETGSFTTTATEIKSTKTELTSENWSQSRKHQYFTEDYEEIVANDVNGQTSTVENGTINFTYTMQNPSNASKSRKETVHILTSYSSAADEYISGDHDELDRTWIPNRLNVTALDPKTEQVYWRGHTNYTVMNKYRTGESSFTNYFFRYVQTLESGPAYSEYEGA